MSAADDPRPHEDNDAAEETLAPDGDIPEPAPAEADATPSSDDARRTQSWVIAVLVGLVVALLVSLIALVGANERSDRAERRQVCERISAHHGRSIGEHECRHIMKRMQGRIDRAHERIGPRGERHRAHPDMTRPGPRGERHSERTYTSPAPRAPETPTESDNTKPTPAPEPTPVR